MKCTWPVLLGFLVLTAPGTVQAQWNYIIIYSNNVAVSITITGYSGPGGMVTIPSTIGNLPVTLIGDNQNISVFGPTAVTSVTIPGSVN
jgi:hypothetical protein